MVLSVVFMEYPYYGICFNERERAWAMFVIKKISFPTKSNSVLSASHFSICWLFWKSWPTKFIPLKDNKKMKIVLSSDLIYLLSNKHCGVTVDDKDGRDEKCFRYAMKISWYLNNMLPIIYF